ncbi:MAG: hypothetical protein AAGK74_01725, partial [Chloroflexota bacterium]
LSSDLAAGMEPHVVSSCEDALDVLNNVPVHMVIAGASTTDRHGVAILDHMRAHGELRHIPLLLVVDHRAPFVAMADEASAILYTPLMYHDVMQAVQHLMRAPVY